MNRASPRCWGEWSVVGFGSDGSLFDRVWRISNEARFTEEGPAVLRIMSHDHPEGIPSEGET